MNRAARRRLAARRSKKRSGYLHRIVAAHRATGLTGVNHPVIEHDAWCSIYRGGLCNCVPNISIIPDNDGGDVVVVDVDGQARKVKPS